MEVDQSFMGKACLVEATSKHLKELSLLIGILSILTVICQFILILGKRNTFGWKSLRPAIELSSKIGFNKNKWEGDQLPLHKIVLKNQKKLNRLKRK